MSLKTKDIKPQIGTEIHAEKAALLGGEHAEEIRELLEQRGVLVFPRISFTDEEQVAFTKTLGKFAPELKVMMDIGDNELPLVWRHRSGRKSLILGCTAYHIIGMDPKASTELLVKLRDWATQERFVYRHQWTVGDMVMWDNTGTMHRALPYDPASGRMLHRTKLEGEEAFA